MNCTRLTFLVPDEERLTADGVEDGKEAGLVRIAEHAAFSLLFCFFNCSNFFSGFKKRQLGVGPAGPSHINQRETVQKQ